MSTSENITNTVGEYFKNLREQKEITLKVISRRTKISLTMLELLESDKLSEMPNRAYIKGYVKSYSKELGVDPREALKLLDQTYHKINNVTLTPSSRDEASSESPLTTFQMAPVSVLAGAGGVIIGLIILVILLQAPGDNHENDVRQEPIAQEALSSQTPLNAQKSVEVTPEEEEQQQPTEEKTNKEEKKFNFYYASNPLYTVAEEMDDDSEDLLTSEVKGKLIKGKQNIFVVSYTGSTWFTYKRDGHPIRRVLLKKGENIYIIGNEVRLFFGNVNVAKIFLNNKLLTTPSRTGVKSLIIPLEKQKKYKLPLFIFEAGGQAFTSDEYIKKHNL